MKPDSRVEKLAAHYAALDIYPDLDREAVERADVALHSKWTIEDCENVGLIIIDPDDNAEVERIASAICRSQNNDDLIGWHAYRTRWMNDARAVLAALRSECEGRA